MNTDIICGWRDAITDPPPDGYYLLSGNTRDSLYCVYMSGQWIEDGSSMLVDIQPGDKWLDITNIPAVPLVKVQAAVDEINMEMKGPEDEWPIRILNYHTGLLPTERE